MTYLVHKFFIYFFFQYHSETIKNLKEAEARIKQKQCGEFTLAIALDTKGPEIRSGILAGVRDSLFIVHVTGFAVVLETKLNILN